MYLWKIRQNLIKEFSNWDLKGQEMIDRLEYYLKLTKDQVEKQKTITRRNPPHTEKTKKIMVELMQNNRSTRQRHSIHRV